MNDLSHTTWPAGSAGRALEALGRGGGLAPRDVEAGAPSQSVVDEGADALGLWIESAARWLGLEAEPRPLRYVEVLELTRHVDAPTLVRVPGGGEPRFVALLRARKGWAMLVCPDLEVRRVRSEELGALLCRTTEEPLAVEVGRLLEEIGVPVRPRTEARAEVDRGVLGASQPPGHFGHEAREAGAAGAAARALLRLARRAVRAVAALVVGHRAGGARRPR